MTHPNLQFLLQQFDQLYDAVEGGAISREAALQQLQQLQVPDATGALWGMDAEGSYVRRAHPDAQALPADPSEYVPIPTPGGGRSLGGGTGGMGGMGGPPAGMQGPPAGVPGQGMPGGQMPGPQMPGPQIPGQPGGGFDPRRAGGVPPQGGGESSWGAPSGTWGAPTQPPMPASPFQDVHEGVDAFSAPPMRGPAEQSGGFPGEIGAFPGSGMTGMGSGPGMGPGGGPGGGWENPGGPSILQAENRSTSGMARVQERLHGRGRLLAVVGACVLVLIGLLVFGPSGSHPQSLPTGPLPSLPANPAPASPSGGITGSDASPTGAPVPPPVVAVPNVGDAQHALTALVSRRREVASSVIASPGDPTHVALETATFAGYAATGITILTGPAATDGSGGAVAEWTLFDTVSKHPIGVAKVHWEHRSAWMLTDWPQFG